MPILRLVVAALAAGLAALPAAAGPVLDRIAERGAIHIGYRTDAPPFSALVDGQPQGFSVVLCGAVAAALKQELGAESFRAKLVPVGTEQRFEALESGEIDILCGATTVTLERRARIDFSIPTFLTGVGAIARSDAAPLLRAVLVEDGPAALSDTVVAEALRNARLGVRRGTTALDWLSAATLETIEGIEIVEFDDHEVGVSQVASGEIDAYLADQAILVALGRTKTGMAISNKAFTHEPYALGLPRGDPDFRLSIDRALSRLYRSGDILKIFERSFGPPTESVLGFYARTAIPE